MTFSKIGKKPVLIPPDVKVNFENGFLTVKGPRGILKRNIPGVSVEIDDKTIKVLAQESKAMHGLMRTLINNMIIGVNEGFSKSLEIVGVGYKVEKKDKAILLYVGFAKPVEFKIPEGVDISVDKGTKIIVSGCSKELVGNIAAKIRRIRPPDAYKGKGIRYSNEIIKLKEGKKATTTG